MSNKHLNRTRAHANVSAQKGGFGNEMMAELPHTVEGLFRKMRGESSTSTEDSDTGYVRQYDNNGNDMRALEAVPLDKDANNRMAFRDAISAFFGGDEKGATFINANCKDLNFAGPSNIDEILGSIMYSKSYRMPETGDGAQPNDIHHEFTDFIIRTALFHRELFGDIVQQLSNRTRRILRMIAMRQARMRMMQNNVQGGNINKKMSGGNEESDTLQKLLDDVRYLISEEQLSPIDKMIVDSIRMICNHLIKNLSSDIVPIETEFNTMVELRRQPDIDETKIDDILRELTNVLSQALIQTQATPSLSRQSLPEALQEPTQAPTPTPTPTQELTPTPAQEPTPTPAQEPTPTPAHDTHFNDEFSSQPSHREKLIQNRTELEKSRGSLQTDKDNIEAQQAKYDVIMRQVVDEKQTTDDKIYKNARDQYDALGLEKKQKMEQIETTRDMITAINAEIEALSVQYGGARISNNNYAINFYNKILRNFNDLPLNAKSFYRAMIKVSVLHNNNEIDLAFANHYQPNELDLELRTHPVDEIPMFAHILPLVPQTVTNIWLTDYRTGTPTIVNDTQPFDNNIFSRTYIDFYQNRRNIGIDFDDVQHHTANFDVDPSAVIKRVLRSHASALSHIDAAPEQEGDYVDITADPVDALWHFDGNKFIRTSPDGSRITYDEYLENTNNKSYCDRALLHTAEGQQCDDKLFAKCLLSNDPDKLQKCFTNDNQWLNDDMFKVANREMRELDPVIAKKILQQFQIRGIEKYDMRYGRKIIIPMSFEEWYERFILTPYSIEDYSETNEAYVFSQEVKNIIKKMPHLQNYLRGVISFALSNPVILNKGLQTIGEKELPVQDNAGDKYPTFDAMRSKVRPYRRPSAKAALEQHARSITAMNGGGFGTVAPPTLSPYANAIGYTSGIMTSKGVLDMTGGGSSVRTQVMAGGDPSASRVAMNDIYQDLSKYGIFISDADKASINGRIKALADEERKLGEYMQVLKVLTDLVKFTDSFNGNGMNSRKIDPKRIILHGELLKKLRASIGEYNMSVRSKFQLIRKEEENIYMALSGILNSATIR